MCDNEGVFGAMNAVAFYSNTGESKAIAKFFAERLNYPLIDVEKTPEGSYENLVLVFPVYSQNLPVVVERFLSRVKTANLTAIATYGKMSCGNVLYEIQKRYGFNIVAGAYIPTKHSYLDGESFSERDSLTPIIDKVNHPSPVVLPKLHKNAFASLLPNLRSRLCVKIYKTADCNACGVCAENCTFGAITNGVTNNRCIRCLKCVSSCPNHALKFKLRLPAKLYLKREKMNELILYT
ncbi:MAG: 4Fe-4S binding protein [Candidatus Coproplasma sp.]